MFHPTASKIHSIVQSLDGFSCTYINCNFTASYLAQILVTKDGNMWDPVMISAPQHILLLCSYDDSVVFLVFSDQNYFFYSQKYVMKHRTKSLLSKVHDQHICSHPFGIRIRRRIYPGSRYLRSIWLHSKNSKVTSRVD